MSVPILLSYLSRYGVNIYWMAFLGTFRASVHFGAYKWSAWCWVRVLHEGRSAQMAMFALYEEKVKKEARK